MRRGLVVRGIPEEHLLEVFTVRAAPDQLAASVAAQSATSPERVRLHWINEQIEARMQQVGHTDIRDLTMQFHEAWLNARITLCCCRWLGSFSIPLGVSERRRSPWQGEQASLSPDIARCWKPSTAAIAIWQVDWRLTI